MPFWIIKVIFDNWKLVLGCFLAITVAFMFLQYKSVLEDNKRMRQEILAANASINALGKKLDIEHDINVKNDIIKNNMKGKEDGSVAPVLDSVIDDIELLR